MRGCTSDQSGEVEWPPKGILRKSKEILFGGNVMVGAGLFPGEIEPRTCCAATVKLPGESCRAVDGSNAPKWPKSTFTLLVLLCSCAVILSSKTDDLISEKFSMHRIHVMDWNMVFGLVILEKCCYTHEDMWLRTLISYVLLPKRNAIFDKLRKSCLQTALV